MLRQVSCQHLFGAVAIAISLSGCALLHPADPAVTAGRILTAIQDMVWSIEEAESVGWIPTTIAVRIVSMLTDVEVAVGKTPEGAIAVATSAVASLQVELASSRVAPYLDGLAVTLAGLSGTER